MVHGKNALARRRLRMLVAAMNAEADNISPKHDDGSGGDSHPAPLIRSWAARLSRCIEKIDHGPCSAGCVYGSG